MQWNEISNKLKEHQFLRRRLPWLFPLIVFAVVAGLGAWLQPPTPDPFEPSGDSFLSSLRYPIERNPHLRLLSVSRDVQSVIFASDGRTGWAVGQSGMILKTADGGETWMLRGNGTSQSLMAVTFAGDDETGWAVGSSGTILKTVDGGERWERRESGTADRLEAVAFAEDGQTGWVVGQNGTILKTTDGGETWMSRSSGTSQWLMSVTFTSDGETGWAVGWDATILKTVDRGENWTPRESQTTNLINIYLEAVTFAEDGRRGWAVGEFGPILKTDDGGETWQERPSPARRLHSVTFADDGTTGWAVGTGGKILKTYDGGDTWMLRSSETSVQLESVTFTGDGARGVAVGQDGTILKTDDGGETWVPRTRGASDDFESVKFTGGGTTGWIVGRNGTILATRNGGATWKPRSSTTTNDLRSVTFAGDGVTGWVVGRSGTILKTVDGGVSWMSRTSNTEDDLNSVTFTDDGTTGWAVGGRGGRGRVLKTTDSGDSWTQPTDGLPDLSSITFSADGATGWAVGPDGVIVKTTDGGQTWESLESGTESRLESVSFTIDGTIGWAVGSRVILKTANGGQTWTPGLGDTEAFLQSVASATDGATAWAVSEYGTILKTNDGDTWASTDGSLPSSLSLTSVAFASDGIVGWIVGHDGTIIKTVNGGATWRSIPKHYRKLPAPWTWILLVIGILAAMPGLLRLPPPPPEPRIADEFIPDRPIRQPDEDTLQRVPIARALSHVLRNPASEAPLTVAITGDWGQGKSSLMKLVQEDLKKHHYNTVWFNAWHHQKEHHLFAALMQAISDQAIPGLLTRNGSSFRMRLACQRARRHWGSAALLLVLVALSVTLLVSPDWLSAATRFATTLEFPEDILGGEANRVASGILSLISVVSLIRKASVPDLKRVKPHSLMVAAARVGRPKTFGDQLGFRHRFRAALLEVVDAMEPYRLAILIDDLDRCRPEQVVETLEAINFLTDAAPCYVVMGIAKEIVTRCVGLGFKDIAQEMPYVSGNPADQTDSSEDAQRLRRAHYARQYLEKIINLEVRLSRVSEADMSVFIQKMGSIQQSSRG